jgi:hypothetical protein
MQLVELKRPHNLPDSLAVVDKLRADLEAGRIVAFWGVSVDAEDSCQSWSAATTGVSRLRGMGAVSYLLACMHSGDT